MTVKKVNVIILNTRAFFIYIFFIFVQEACRLWDST